jgi:two pore calcium channel protein 1
MRFTRALRPIFAIDCYYSHNVRRYIVITIATSTFRFIRQVFQSMPPVLDMLFMLLIVMVAFSLFGL